jgi:hypothetical protein
MMRKLILRWLFGIENVDKYMELWDKYEDLSDKYVVEIRQHRDRIEAHLKTLDEFINILNDMKKLIKICENHGIDVDKEIKEVEL